MVKVPFKLDLGEKFTRLANPPIVEAIIHWQARSTKPLQPEQLRLELAEELPEYTTCEPVQHFTFQATALVDENPPIVQHQHRWHGYRLMTGDKLHIAQFTRDGVTFSRMPRYEDWEDFAGSAKKVWHVFEQLAAPIEIQRLGVRFINQIPSATVENIHHYLKDPPTCPSNLPLNEFLYQSTFSVPDQPFGIRVNKVMQPATPGQQNDAGLLLDFEVYSTRPIPTSDKDLDEALLKMRWIKNKIFFDLVTEEAVTIFK